MPPVACDRVNIGTVLEAAVSPSSRRAVSATRGMPDEEWPAWKPAELGRCSPTASRMQGPESLTTSEPTDL